MAKVVFLDRDGTLNFDPGYLNDAGLLKLIPGAGEALKILKQAGYRCVVVTNQSGVGRGLITLDQVHEIHQKMNQLFQIETGIPQVVDDFLSCYHAPVVDCDCRKPKPKLILDYAKEHSVNLKESILIGDRGSDLAAGRNAGLGKVILVKTGDGSDTALSPQKELADYCAQNVLEAARWVIGGLQ